MSNRRMFSSEIVSSDNFLDMGQGAQVLYFHLAMRADDDGFVSPKSVMRMIGIADDELKVLLAKRFILPFESGVVVIKHWLIHNLIRADLYKETQYKKEKSTLGLNDNGAYTELRVGVSEIKNIEAPKWLKERRKEQRTANGTQTVHRLGKDRLGKDRLGKDSLEDSTVAIAPRHRFQKPTIQEVQEYIDTREVKINSENFINFYDSKNWFVGKTKMCDWKAAVRTWENRESKKPQSSGGSIKIR